MSIAFFDLDKTIIADNSARLWLKSQWKNGRIKPVQMLIASYWLTKYHLGFTKMEDVIEKSLAMLKGEKESFVLSQTNEFFLSTIKNLYRPGALKTIHHHRKKGHQVALITSSFNGLAELVSDDLELNHCLSTVLETDAQGLYTGKTAGPACFGMNKAVLAKELCQKSKIPLHECSFYTDSASDIFLLNLVGKPVVVNPDPHLRAKAKFKKWQVVDWGRPS